MVFGGAAGYIDRGTGPWAFSHLLVVSQILLDLTEDHPVVGSQTGNRCDPKDDEPNRLLEIAGTDLGTEPSPKESDSTLAGFLLVVNLVLDSTQGPGHTCIFHGRNQHRRAVITQSTELVPPP